MHVTDAPHPGQHLGLYDLTTSVDLVNVNGIFFAVSICISSVSYQGTTRRMFINSVFLLQ